VDAWRKALLGGDGFEEPSKLAALGVVERGQDVVLVGVSTVTRHSTPAMWTRTSENLLAGDLIEPCDRGRDQPYARPIRWVAVRRRPGTPTATLGTTPPTTDWRMIMYGVARTGVRLVLTNAADPNQLDDFGAWYDAYGEALTRIGQLANDFRFENPNAQANSEDPRFAAIYDIAAADPATAWPDTENSPDYPTHLFDDPRSALVSPVFRASYALVGSQQTLDEHRGLTGVHLSLTSGADDTSRQRWTSQVLSTGLFYAASRFRLIEGYPDPPEWLEILETDRQDPSKAYGQALEAVAPTLPDTGIRAQRAGSFRLVSAYPPPR